MKANEEGQLHEEEEEESDFDSLIDSDDMRMDLE